MLSQELVSDTSEAAKENCNGENGAQTDDESGACSSTGGSGSGSGSIGFRVKDVSEINGNMLASNEEEDVVTCADEGANSPQVVGSGTTACGSKRKLPAWMERHMTETPHSDVDDTEASSSKKQKITEDCEAVVTSVQEDESTNEGDVSTATTTTVSQIKTEPVHAVEAEDAAADTSAEIDGQPTSSGTGSVTKLPFDVKPAAKVEKVDASSTSRESCRFGIRCYRRNPMHRIDEAHPGDHDYKRPNYPEPPLGTPACPYGNSCYRRNPAHFEQFSHPPDTDFEKNYRMRLRIRRQRQQTILVTSMDNDDSDDLDDFDLDDPFLDDSDVDDDYVPSNDEGDEEGDEDEEVDYDDCDKAEE